MITINWKSSTDPFLMLQFLAKTQKVAQVQKGRRRLRLFACACCRSVWDLLDGEDERAALAVSEQYADGLVVKEKLEETRKQLFPAMPELPEEFANLTFPEQGQARVEATQTLAAALHLQPMNGARQAVYHGNMAAVFRDAEGTPQCRQVNSRFREEARKCCDLLREIFGNPLRPLPHTKFPDPVRGVAEAAYQAQEAGHFLVLADAVEEHGQLERQLGRSWRDPKTGQYLPVLHLRQPDVAHVKGCHVVDWLRGQP